MTNTTPPVGRASCPSGRARSPTHAPQDNAKRLGCGSVALYGVLVLNAGLVLYPIFWLVCSSLRTSHDIFARPWGLPTIPELRNYLLAWREAGIGRYFLNSLVVTSISLVAILFVSAMAAHVLARFRFRGQGLIYNLFLSGMMFPVFLGIVPLFLLLTDLRLCDTRLGLILVYIAYSLSFTVFVLTGFFRTVPRELLEAGLVDGCSEFGVFFRLMLPLGRAGIITAAIFNFFGLWNEYPLALVIINSDELRTLPLGIASLVMVQQYKTEWGALFAGLVMVMIPTIIVYALFKRQIVEGISTGALKG